MSFTGRSVTQKTKKKPNQNTHKKPNKPHHRNQSHTIHTSIPNWTDPIRSKSERLPPDNADKLENNAHPLSAGFVSFKRFCCLRFVIIVGPRWPPYSGPFNPTRYQDPTTTVLTCGKDGWYLGPSMPLHEAFKIINNFCGSFCWITKSCTKEANFILKIDNFLYL